MLLLPQLKGAKMHLEPSYWVVIPAAGLGSRFSQQRPKQYWRVAGLPLLEHTLGLFINQTWVKGVIVAISDNDPYFKQLSPSIQRQVTTVTGGDSRAQSVMNALKHISLYAQVNDWVLVHDAVRPCLHNRDLEALRQLHTDPVGGILAKRVVDTLKRVNADHQISQTIEREGLWHAQTPQMFRLGLLTQALEKESSLQTITDEASAIEALGHMPRVVSSLYPNPKLTYSADLAYIAHLLEQETMSIES